MRITVFIAGLSLGAAACAAAPASAQDAVETGVILSGSSGQARAQSRLGGAIRGSLDGATRAIQTTPRRNTRRAAQRVRARGRGRGRGGNASAVYAIQDSGDALAYSDTETYEMQSGTRIRVSGGFTPSRTTICAENCAPDTAQENNEAVAAETESPE
ncbi:hypothetical protein [Qipengyuania sphaerica]|uniref:hypothetical protein n=1 Tax=Qipengyuania sphaerica TaxID=2867243 RepID=UPI001C8709C0|nr:hypothetical protein [Qipengyuania sphaerica]MBX7539735.1 hypothetical protein [Qipengyuania sphaerica]